MRYTTKETLRIDTKDLNKFHCFEHDSYNGRFVCFWNRNGQQAKSIVSFETSTIVGDRYIHFMDLETDEYPGIKTKLDCIAKLDFTPCHFGNGLRWWFVCPMLVNDGQPCNKRVRVLYLPSGTIFGCRHCHNIAYQRSVKRRIIQ
jgi:Zn-finger protein